MVFGDVLVCAGASNMDRKFRFGVTRPDLGYWPGQGNPQARDPKQWLGSESARICADGCAGEAA